MLIFSFCLDFSVFQADTKHFEQVSHLAHDIKWAGKWQFSTDCEVLRGTIKKKKKSFRHGNCSVPWWITVFWKSSGWSEWALDRSAEYLLLNLHWAPSVMICEITSCCYGPYSKGFNDTSLKNSREAVQIEFLSENTCKHMLRKVKETPLFFWISASFPQQDSTNYFTRFSAGPSFPSGGSAASVRGSIRN